MVYRFKSWQVLKKTRQAESKMYMEMTIAKTNKIIPNEA